MQVFNDQAQAGEEMESGGFDEDEGNDDDVV
jgi:hypothetical protein